MLLTATITKVTVTFVIVVVSNFFVYSQSDIYGLFNIEYMRYNDTMRKLYYFVLYSLPALAFAQNDTCDGLICNPLDWAKTSDGQTVQTIPQFLDMLLGIMIMVAMPLTAILMIWTGFQYAMAKGDQTKLKKARDSILYIIVGLAILLASKGLQMTLQATVDSLSTPTV